MVAVEVLQTFEYRGGQLNDAPVLEDFQDSPDDEENTRSSHEYLNDVEEEYQARALLAKSKRFFKKASKASMVKIKGLINESYEWDEEEVSSDDNEMVEVNVLMALAGKNDAVSKEGARNGKWVKISMRKRILGVDQLTEDLSYSGQKDLVFVKSLADDTKVTIPGVERPWLSEAEGFILPNHDIGRILPAKSRKNTTDPSVAVTDSSATDYDSVDESSVCNTPFPPLKKLDGAEPISGPKTIKSIMRIISLEREINPRNPQHTFKRCEVCGSSTHTTTDHYDIEWLKRDEALQAKKAEALNQLELNHQMLTDLRLPLKGPKVVFGDDSTCTTKGYGSIKCNGIVFTKVAFVNGLKYNLISISQLYDAMYIVQFDEKRGIIFKSNKEVVMIAPRDKPCSSCENRKHHRASFKTKQTFSIKKCLNLLRMDLFGHVTPRFINHEEYTLIIVDGYSRNSILVNFYIEKWISQNFSSPYTSEQNGVIERKNRTLIEAARTMLSGFVFSKQYWTEAVATAWYTQNRSTIVKRQLKTPYEIFRKRIPNISFLHVFGCPIYIHSHKDHLGKFDEKADDGYLLRYSLVSKAFRVFNTRRKQTEKTYHVTFDESPDAIKFSKPSVDNINIAETERYPPDEYLHPYEPSYRYQTNNNDVSFIEPYEYLEPVVFETKVSSDQNGQTDQNDQSAQNDEILNDDHSEHSNHTNDEKIIDNLPNTEDIQISEHLFSPSVEDTSVQNTIPILAPHLPIPSMVTSAPQDRWSQDKHIELVNIIGNPGARMLTRAMAKQLSAASAHECLFVDFLS
uniref:Integrase catalytic domain-containing protein n=1 Tax=Tanacetum cinerariifolium TaxID=118510 RepID=A0A6L2LJA7_TANCI|nr:hypothetical protein [Tanacetum cinerariifolium]